MPSKIEVVPRIRFSPRLSPFSLAEELRRERTLFGLQLEARVARAEPGKAAVAAKLAEKRNDHG
jgi:hypothetical protein